MHSVGILSPRWRGVLKVWADQHNLHTFDLECEHGANKQRAHMANKWWLIAARSVNSFTLGVLAGGDQPAALAGAAPAAVPAGVGNNVGSRARSFKSPLQLFHNRCSKRDRALGTMVGSAATLAFRGREKREWAALSDADRRAVEAPGCVKQQSN